MSNQETLSQAADFSPEQAITIQPSGVAAYTGAADWPPAEGEQAKNAIGPEALGHSLRRHWLVMFAVGLAAAAAVGTAVLLIVKPKYEASATLIVAPRQPILYSSGTTDDSEHVSDEFNIFRGNQAILMKEHFVLAAALRNSKVMNLASVQRADARHNAIPWLSSIIQVDPKRNSGIMTVSVTLPDPAEAAAIVNAVVGAYMDEVVNYDRQKRRDRYDSLQRIANEKEEEVHQMRQQLRTEMERLGAGDDQTASARGQMAMQVYAEYLRELQRMKFERTTLLSKLESAKAIRRTVDDQELYKVPTTELTSVMGNNPMYKELLPRQQLLQSVVDSQMKMVAKGAKASPALERAKAELANTDAAINSLKVDADKQVREAKRIELDREIFRLDAEENIARIQVAQFEKEVEVKKTQADDVGKISVDAQMQRAKLENVERILHGVVDERERLKIELDSKPRVAIAAGPNNPPAAIPEQESGAVFRYMLVLASALFAMCLPAVGIIAWDVRKQRVNSSNDVSKRLKLSVMGVLPFIPAGVMRKLGSPSRRSQIWKMRYTEAVDGIAARLLRNAECEQTRVVLVTSATSGEGKTWLATQLAMGLARAQRRTVLVDFDLRQPALDGAMGLPLGPGVCEALRGQGEIEQMVQATDTEYLSVVTAGTWNRQVLPALANGSVSALLEQLRGKFDFVILDSSPLLPVVDTRLVCQHVDAVMLSVLRDVSESEKVLAAQEMLDAFGVARVDTVVTGGDYHGSAKSLLYQAALAEEN